MNKDHDRVSNSVTDKNLLARSNSCYQKLPFGIYIGTFRWIGYLYKIMNQITAISPIRQIILA